MNVLICFTFTHTHTYDPRLLPTTISQTPSASALGAVWINNRSWQRIHSLYCIEKNTLDLNSRQLFEQRNIHVSKTRLICTKK